MKNELILKCKNQFVKQDEDGRIMYKCILTNGPSLETMNMKEHFEKMYPEHKFLVNNGECHYAYLNGETKCPYNR